MKTNILLSGALLILFTFCCLSANSLDEIGKTYYKAEECFKSGDNDSAIAYYTKIYEMTKNGTTSNHKQFNALILYNIAICYTRKGDYKGALDRINDLGKNPKMYDVSEYRKGINYLKLYSLYKNGQYAEVTKSHIDLFKKIEFKNLSDKIEFSNDALYLIADSYFRVGEYEKALNAFKELKDPYEEEGKYRIANCLLYKGWNLFEQKQYVPASETFELCKIKLVDFCKNTKSPFFAAAYYGLGIIDISNKEYSNANINLTLAIQEAQKNIKWYEEMVSKAQSSINDINSITNMNRIWMIAEEGDSLFKEGKYNEAIIKYAEVCAEPSALEEIKLYSSIRQVLCYLGSAKTLDKDKNIVFNKELINKSISAYKQAIEKKGFANSPDIKNARIQLALILYQDKEFSQSAELFNQIESDFAKYYVGCCYYQIAIKNDRKLEAYKDNMRKAIDAFVQVLESYRSSTYATHAYNAMIIAYTDLANSTEEYKEVLNEAKGNIEKYNNTVNIVANNDVQRFEQDINYGKDGLFLFSVSQELQTELEKKPISMILLQKFADNKITLSQNAMVEKTSDEEWQIKNEQQVYTIKKGEGQLNKKGEGQLKIYNKFKFINDIIDEMKKIVGSDSDKVNKAEKQKAQLMIAHMKLWKGMRNDEFIDDAISEYENALIKSETIAKYQILLCNYVAGEKAEYKDNTVEMKKYYKEVVNSVNDLLKLNIDKEMELGVTYMLGMAAYQIENNDIVTAVFETKDNKDIAIKAFEKFKEFVKNMESIYENVYVCDARYKLARLYTDKGQYKEAIDEFGDLIKIYNASYAKANNNDTDMDLGMKTTLYSALKAYYGLAYCYEGIGNKESCKDAALKGLDCDGKLKPYYDEILNPNQIIDKNNLVLYLNILAEHFSFVDPLDPKISLELKLKSYYGNGNIYYNRAEKEPNKESKRDNYGKALDQFLKFEEIPVGGKVIKGMQIEEKKKAIESMQSTEKSLVKDSLYMVGSAAFKIVEGEHWDKTISALEDFVIYTNSGLFGKKDSDQKQLREVQYFLGDSYYNNAKYYDSKDQQKALDNYISASVIFKNVLDNTNHEFAEFAMYKMLLYYEKIRVISVDDLDNQITSNLDQEIILTNLRQQFSRNGIQLSGNALVEIKEKGNKWLIVDKQTYSIRKDNSKLNIYMPVISIDDSNDQVQSDLDQLLLSVSQEFQTELDKKRISSKLRQEFTNNSIILSPNATITSVEDGNEWQINDEKKVYNIKNEKGKLNIYGTDQNIISQDLRQKFSDNNIQLSDNAKVAILKKESKWLIVGEQTYTIKKENGTMSIYMSDNEKYYNLAEKLLMLYPKSIYAQDCILGLYEVYRRYSVRGQQLHLPDTIQEAVNMYISAINTLEKILTSKITMNEPELLNFSNSYYLPSEISNFIKASIYIHSSLRKPVDGQFLVTTLKTLATNGVIDDIRGRALSSLNILAGLTNIDTADNTYLSILILTVDDKNSLRQFIPLVNDSAKKALEEIKNDEAKKPENELQIKKEDKPGEAKQEDKPSEAKQEDKPGEIKEENNPIEIKEENKPSKIILEELELYSLLRREMLLGLISFENYKMILDGKNPILEDWNLDMSITWWNDIKSSIQISSPILYVEEKINTPEMQIPPKQEKEISLSKLMWTPSTEPIDRSKELHELNKWRKLEDFLTWRRLKDVGPAVISTAAVIVLLSWQERYFSEWPDKTPDPLLPKSYETGRLKEPPTFPSKKISPDEWEKQDLSSWYYTPRIKTQRIISNDNHRALGGTVGCFAIGATFTGVAIHKWFNRDIVFPSEAK